MKNTLTIVSLFSFSIFAYAQEDCQEFIDMMSISVKTHEFDKAKSLMKDFVACKEQSLGNDNPIIPILNDIDYIPRFENDYTVCRLKKNNLAVILNRKLEYKILNYEYDNLFSDSLATVRDVNTRKIGYVDYNGKLIIPCIFDRADGFMDNGMALVNIVTNNKNGYKLINKLGNDILPNINYDPASPSEGLAVISFDNEKVGFINNKGETVIPAIYYAASQFCNGYAWVSNKKREVALIDKDGKIKIPFTNFGSYSDVLCKEGFYIMTKAKKFGIIDFNGNVIIPFIYKSISSQNINSIYVSLNGEKYFEINTKGECVKDCENAPADHPKAKN